MSGLDVIDPRYRQLWVRASAVLESDERVRSVATSGSVGDGACALATRSTRSRM